MTEGQQPGPPIVWSPWYVRRGTQWTAWVVFLITGPICAIGYAIGWSVWWALVPFILSLSVLKGTTGAVRVSRAGLRPKPIWRRGGAGKN